MFDVRRVAADNFAAKLLRSSAESRVDLLDRSHARVRPEADADDGPPGEAAHRGDIAEISCHCLPADLARWSVRCEVDTFDNGIARNE